jgi:hypothetical protein
MASGEGRGKILSRKDRQLQSSGMKDLCSRIDSIHT